MPDNFYISDLHFSHGNIINFDKRPFFTVEEMNNELINRWNSVVQNGDNVYILGDFCWSSKENEWCKFLDQLNGTKILIRGNHDLKNPSANLKKKFTDIKDYKEITDGQKHIIMSHYPILLYKGSYSENTYMLCGHVHKTRENEFLEKWRAELKASRSLPSDSYGNIINVGCMMPYMNYTPRTLQELIDSNF